MSDQLVYARLPFHHWQAMGLRLTAFPDPSAQLAPEAWWQDATGDPPETRTSKPKLGVLSDEGPLPPGKLSLSIEPLRIDWVFVPADRELPDQPGIPSISPLPEATQIFARPMERWLQHGAPPLRRLAFGAIAIIPVDSVQAGYRQLAPYLPPLRLDPDTSSDFLYQINRARPARLPIPSLRINRLSKWSVMALAHAVLQVGPSPAQFFNLQQFACRLELDINTAPDSNDLLPNDQLVSIFREFVDLANEIASEGDIP